MDGIMKKNKKIWFVVFLCLTAGTLYGIIAQSKSFSFRAFLQYIAGASPTWTALAVVCMFGFVLFEGLGLLHISRSLGYRRSVSSGTAYSAADIFFSAITPSATGGQPACACCMIKDGIPAAVTTVTLLLNLVMYLVALIVIGGFCFLVRPAVFFVFSPLSRFLIILGYLIQFFLVVTFLLLVFKEKIVRKIADCCLLLLHKIHLVRDQELWHKRLAKLEQEYKACSDAVRQNKKMLIMAFFYNLFQRVSLIFVSVCVFLGVGGRLSSWPDVWFVQSLVTIGSNSVPVPGAVGVADYLFLDGFRSLTADTVSIELLSRGISFYCCIILCGLIAWGWIISYERVAKRRKHRQGEKEL